ncbi:esterase/lipase family protein [Streptomyces sp. NPDC058001]|uniref:esterase/lipase family protein n=1 Tax=Streptomyces sp. NPDC058001 TaxID=3346300 RepID=UPI0036E00918
MKVPRVLPVLPLLQLWERLLPTRLSDLPALAAGRAVGLSAALFKATILECAILAGHVVLYPTGMIQERHPTPRPRTPDDDTAPASAPGSASASDGHPTPVPDPTRLPTATLSLPPVMLLHGFIDNRSVFVLLRRALAQGGREHIESLNYSPLTGDIRAAAELLGRHIEELCERTGRDEVDIVGHSLGGLIARYYVQRLGGDLRVRTLVTLGTPHAGTRVAPLLNAHPIVRQMRPGSDVIKELAEPAPECRTRFVSFWSDLDHWMEPLETASLEHPDLVAENVRVTGIGHLALPVHPAVAAGIRQALDHDLHHTEVARTAATANTRTRAGRGRQGPVKSSSSSGLTVA